MAQKTSRKEWIVRILALLLAAAMIVNFYMFFLKKMDSLWFWAITMFIAGMAYFGIPDIIKRMRE